MADDKPKKRSLMIGRQRQAAQDEQDRQRQEVHKGYADLIKTFQTSTDMEERAQIAQTIRGTIDDPDTDQGTRTVLSEYSKGLRLKEYMELYKATHDLQSVGAAAQKLVDPSAPFTPERTLDELKQDETLDPMAKEVATRFATYLPKYNKYKQHQKTSQRLPDDEIIEKEGTKDVVRDARGNILMKPAGSDDPRSVGLIARSMEGVLAKGDAKAVKLGKQPWDDRKRGAGVVAQLGEGASKLTSDVGKYIVTKSMAFDPDRTHEILTIGEQTLNKKVSRDIGL